MRQFFILLVVLITSSVTAQSKCDQSALLSVLRDHDAKIAMSRRDIPAPILAKLDSIGFNLCFPSNSSRYHPSSGNYVLFTNNYIVVDYWVWGIRFAHALTLCTISEGVIDHYDLPVKVNTRDALISYMASHKLNCYLSQSSKK